MISALNQGSLIYILDKTDNIKLEIGEIVGVTQPKISTTFNSPYYNQMIVSIKVKVDGNITEYGDIPTNASVAVYNNGNIVLSETKAGLQNEVETTLQNFKQILSKKDYYEQGIKDCEVILKEISPQFAKDKERDDKMTILESRVTGMEDKIDKMLELLSKK